jgi:hypothetical protein
MGAGGGFERFRCFSLKSDGESEDIGLKFRGLKFRGFKTQAKNNPPERCNSSGGFSPDLFRLTYMEYQGQAMPFSAMASASGLRLTWVAARA